jgi:RNA polymerase sigma factor (sigma-70 family)
MASASTGDVQRQLRQLFEAGSAVGLTDGQLLERFASADPGSAESAFETILSRHGSTVLAVCRQVLGDAHAAEDAFQATFLVLIRRAGSLRLRETGSLGPWLHGVAYRTALQARRGAMRRQAREHRVAVPEARAGQGTAVVDRDDLGAALHEEVNRLPSKYRAPVVLCYFEGRTHDEAAAALDWPVGTVRSYLSRARDLLRGRLARRGLAPAGWIGVTWIEGVARAEVPSALRTATVAAAIKGNPGATVGALASLVLRSLLLARVRTAASALALVLMAAGLGLVLRGAMATQPPRSADPDPVAAQAERPRAMPVDRTEGLLPKYARAHLGTLGFHGGNEAQQVLYTRDGKSLVTIDVKRLVGVWDAATGRLAHEIVLSETVFDWINLSPDGTTLATSDVAGGLRLWDVASGRERRRWHQPKDINADVHPTFSPDGRTLVTLGNRYNNETRQYQPLMILRDLTASSERRRLLVGDWASCWNYEICPDGKTVVLMNGGFGADGAAPRKGWIQLRDISEDRERSRFPTEGLLSTMALSPDGRLLAVPNSDRTIHLYDPATGRESLPRLGRESSPPPRPPDGAAVFPTLDRDPRLTSCLAFSRDGSILAAGSTGAAGTRGVGGEPPPAMIHLWDVAHRRELRGIPAHEFHITALAFSPDGRTLASTGGSESVIRLWDVATGREAFPQSGHRFGIGAVAVSPADGTVFTGSYNGTIRRWDPASGRDLGLIARLESGVLALAVAPDGQTLAAGGHLEDLVLWSVAGRRELRRLPRIVKRSPTRQVAFSPDGRTVASQRRIWDVATGRERVTLRRREEPEGYVPVESTIAYLPEGRRVVTVDDGGARIWEIASGEEVRRAVPIDEIFRFGHSALSADGRFLATSGFIKDVMIHATTLDPSIGVWDLATGRQVARLEGHDGILPGALAFSPDGRLLASSAGDMRTTTNPPPRPRDRTVRVWDLATGRERRRFEGHRGIVGSVAFTPDGRALISASDDATALVWDVSDLRDDRITPERP